MASALPGRTLSEGDSRRARIVPGTQPCLFRVMSCERIFEPPSRHPLGHIVTVEIGRSPEREVARSEKRLSLGIPDPRASARHAQLTRVLDAWMIEDLGSRNGTLVNGKRETRALVNDGDVIEIGRSFFIFRAALAVADGDVDAPADAPGLVTLLPELSDAFARLAEMARAQVPVLISGASGTGKELVARAVHALSKKKGEFVAVNCGALPANLVESELFGAQKGAFSGADRDRPGLIRSAHGGTLFLDEIGELPPPAQVALLRVLQEREVMPVGGTRPVPVDFGLVTATLRDLPAQIAAGRFRSDLYARIAGHRLELLPLQRRREDFGILVAALLSRAPRRDLTLSLDAGRALLAHDWPLNVRELEQCLLAGAALATHGRIEREHLSFMPRLTPEAPALAPEDLEHRDRLLILLEQHQGNVTRVAEAVGKERMQIHRWIKRYQIDLARFRNRKL